jgi:hypothetical protein
MADDERDIGALAKAGDEGLEIAVNALAERTSETIMVN